MHKGWFIIIEEEVEAMENNLSTQWDPALSGVRSQQKERTYSPAGKAEAETGFRETFQSALKTTESMESIFREASQLYGVELNLLKAIGKAESNFNLWMDVYPESEPSGMNLQIQKSHDAAMDKIGLNPKKQD